MFRIILSLCAWVSMIFKVSGQELGVAKKFAPMFEQHCLECHDGDVKKGGLDLTSLTWKPENAENFRQWVKVHDKVRSGEMPPKKKGATCGGLVGEFPQELERAAARFAVRGLF
jgi:mono/diheme cytochrome c family protein